MSYIDFLLKGKEKEKEFGRLVGATIYATPYQDMHEHWDLIYNDKKIDVKGIKKISRTNLHYNENWHWIERLNVNGKLGWIYGMADSIAFETINYWILVDRDKLLKFILKYSDLNEIDEKKPYSTYRRYGRNDAITLINTFDLMYLAYEIIPKKKFYKYDDLIFE